MGPPPRRREGGPIISRRCIRIVHALCILALPPFCLVVDGLLVDSSVILNPGEAKVLGKYTIGFDPVDRLYSGEIRFKYRLSSPSSAPSSSSDGESGSGQKAPGQLWTLLLDDQKESFPAAQPGWGRSSCAEKQKAARWSGAVPANQDPPPDGYQIKVQQHVRPRVWYVAFCYESSRAGEGGEGPTNSGPLYGYVCPWRYFNGQSGKKHAELVESTFSVWCGRGGAGIRQRAMEKKKL